MEKYTVRFLGLMLILISATSCELIGDIFQVGMALGIILIILIIALVFWVIRRFRR